SGLAYHNSNLWSHNDSGGGAYIYKADQNSGKVLQLIKVSGIKNRDWEDMAIDSSYIYIADFGNNNLKRKKLRIIKISLDSLNSEKALISPEQEIKFEYKRSGRKKVRHDAEALVSYKDFLYIFTKEKSGQSSLIYRINKTDPEQNAEYIGTFRSKGMITGACYDQKNDEILLVGSDKIGPVYVNFLWQFDPTTFTSPAFSANYHSLDLNNQVEGITLDSSSNILISAESQNLTYSKLYTLQFNELE
ncbi:MAG: hypothetical protein KJN68_07710, partial [Bacteroidia bacterium]|nr:hypothetical protein [Bacteroidia bacterium]